MSLLPVLNKDKTLWASTVSPQLENLSQSVNQMEDMKRYSALETQTSAGVRMSLVTRLLAHIVGAHQNVLLKVSDCDRITVALHYSVHC